MPPRPPLFTEFTDAAALTTAALEWITERVKTAITERGVCVLVLSGGSTPGPVYTALGQSKDIDWAKVWVTLADDRYIRADDPKSNQFLLRSTLLKHAPIPESQILLPDPSLPIDECVAKYGQEVTALVTRHGIDVLTLGMGDDGHTASLFPPLEDAAFGPAVAIHTTTDRFDIHDRISLTLPVLTQARESLLLLKGHAKKTVYDEMFASKEGPSRWPLKMIKEMTVLWTA